MTPVTVVRDVTGTHWLIDPDGWATHYEDAGAWRPVPAALACTRAELDADQDPIFGTGPVVDTRWHGAIPSLPDGYVLAGEAAA